ncbi:MAG: hypothetical protein QNK37_27835 [Acidobacteriota bacterium]|nr:hypothetical protein [Acidobacteriota bacterium]
MRLKRIENGYGLQRLQLWIMRLILRGRVPDVLRTVLYRPGFFGNAYSEICQSVMRLSREWTVGECELFAAFVSSKNQCPF